jgi:small-conductance mechanosensitive channel
MLDYLKNHFNEPAFIKIRNIFLIIVLGYLIIQVAVLLVRKAMGKHPSQQTRFLINKTIVYVGVSSIILMILNQLDIKLAALLGAAGIVGIIIGIASQSSIGNIVSGIFMISEKTFEIGDLIRVGDKLGVVYAIDLLSVKLKTQDNLLIRIPNQTMISTEVTNITRFPIRRMDIELGVAYKEDLRKVLEVLKKIAKENPLCLDEPEPLILIRKYGESSIDLLFGLWFEKTNYVKLRNSILTEIKETFDKEAIEIPFPHRTIYTGEATLPFPVKTFSD